MYVLESVHLIPDDFYIKEHQFIFEAIKELWDGRKTIDVITVGDALQKKDRLDHIG